MTEKESLDLFRILGEKRQQWQAALGGQQEDFRTDMPGGAFLYKTKGEVAQVLQAEGRSKAAR
eukprot:3939112-Lingulodinium_polyedra.AAC.1